MRVFDHIGITTTVKQPNERYVAKTKVWVTDHQQHPYCVEWLRYEPDSPVPDLLRNTCHVAWRVDSIEKEAQGLKVILPPFASVPGHVVGFYQTPDGAIVELMEYEEDRHV